MTLAEQATDPDMHLDVENAPGLVVLCVGDARIALTPRVALQLSSMLLMMAIDADAEKEVVH